MYIRKINIKKDGKSHAYWALVESRRTPRGPRQHVIAYLGAMDTSGRLGIKMAAEGRSDFQEDLFENQEPEWIEINLKAVRTERVFGFGDIWLALELIKRLGLDEFFHRFIPKGRGVIPWADMAIVLIIARFCDPKSELYIAEHFYSHSSLPFLVGIPTDKIYVNRLYRALDKLLPHKEELEIHLKERFGTLFQIHYDLLLYDITSTYFEGECKDNEQAQRGHSRDKRPDCKQVLIALVVTREGIPLGYEIFDGNRHDSTTVKDIVTNIEDKYGTADRIWVMDRGMVSAKNISFLQQSNRRYIIGTPKSMLKKFEKQLLSKEWHTIHEGIEVQYCPSADGEETFILCRSASRKEKDKAIFERFKKNIQDGLSKIEKACDKGQVKEISVAERRIGRLLQRNTRAARLFDITVQKEDSGKIVLSWSQRKQIEEWVALSNGCYLLRSNITDWSAQELWQAYIHLTDAEEAFRIHKSDLNLRPIWHYNKERVQAHILVCFLAFVLWKCLAQMCKQAGLGNEPRKIVDELQHIKLTEVILPTRKGVELKLNCVSKPDPYQQIILEHLNLTLPSRLAESNKM
jgi:transposase